MTPTSSADGPTLPRAITADRYSDGTAFGSPHARPAIPRAVYPEPRPPGRRGREYLLDVVAAALAAAEPGQDPALLRLLDDHGLVEDVCRDYAMVVTELERTRDQLAGAHRLLLGRSEASDCTIDTLDTIILDDSETS